MIDDVKALQCDKCQSQAWKCIDCLSLTADLYDQLMLQPSCALRWYCGSCDKTVTETDSGDRIDKLVSVVEKLMERFMDMEDKFKEKGDLSAVMQLDTRIKCLEDKFCRYEENLELRLAAVDNNVSRYINDKLSGFEEQHRSHSTGITVVEQAVKEEISRKIDEDKEIEHRKKNVIVHGVPESDADSVDRRIDDDMAVLAAMFHEEKMEDVKVESIVRLGKKADDPTQKPRPMKVVLDSEDNKINLLKKAKT